MEKVKVILSFLLIIFTAGVFNSCGTLQGNTRGMENAVNVTTESGSSNTSIKNEDNNKITLTYWVPLESWASPAIKSYDDCEVFMEVEKATGIHIKWIHPPIEQETEQFNLMIASDNLPDIIQQAGRYRGGVSKGVRDGVYLKLNDLIDKYAPNYKWIRNMDPEISKGTIDDLGNICAFFGISPYEDWIWWGPLLRKDWMDELNLKIPETMEDWYTILKQFKEIKGAEAPIIFPPNGMDWCSIFMSAYDAYNGFFYKDGKVQFGPIQPGMKEYLTEMNKWYSEGLIDCFFPGRDWGQWQKMLVSGKSGAIFQSPETILGVLEPYNIKVAAAPYPVLKKGEENHMRWKGSKVIGHETSVTTQCLNPKIAVKWLDFGYSQKGWELYNYGIEGRTHIKDSEGKPMLWEDSIIYHDPDGIPAINALWRYKLHWGPYLRDEQNSNPILVQNKQAQEIREMWTETNDGAYWMPPAVLMPEEGEKEACISTQINTYIDEMIVKFIMGIESLEKFDYFVEQIEKMGLDQILEIRQKAVNRYLNRKD